LTNFLVNQKTPNTEVASKEPFKPNPQSFFGHRSKDGISLLVIHKFEGIPKTYPKFVALILDNVLGQAKISSISIKLKTDLVLFWELDDLVFAMAKSETYLSFGFRQSDFPTILPTGSKGSSIKYPTPMSENLRGLEWLKLARDNVVRHSPQSKTISPLDSIITELTGPIPLSQESPVVKETVTTQDSDIESSLDDESPPDPPEYVYPATNLFGYESDNVDPPMGFPDTHPLNSIPPNPPSSPSSSSPGAAVG
jgi:hypothetical protein